MQNHLVQFILVSFTIEIIIIITLHRKLLLQRRKLKQEPL